VQKIKYYVYLSAAKINMMFQQLFSDITADISTTFSLKLGFVSAETTSTEDNSSENLYQKLNIICRHIEDVGGITSETSSYIQSSLPMLWGLSKGRERATYWIGRYEVDDIVTDVLLIGSAGHILGGGMQPQRSCESALPFFLREINSEIEHAKGRSKTDKIMHYSISSIIERIHELTPDIYCDYEFLAKILLRGEEYENGKTRKYIVASPIYVACE